MEEFSFVVFEGQRAEDLKDTEMFLQWQQSGMKAAPDGGESITAFAGRVAAGFEEVVEDMMKNKITAAALIIPGGVMMNLLAAFGYPKRDPLLWSPQEGTGYTALLNTQLWQRDKVFEVYSQVPLAKEPWDNGWGEEEEDDQAFFQSLPKSYAAWDLPQSPNSSATPEQMEQALEKRRGALKG